MYGFIFLLSLFNPVIREVGHYNAPSPGTVYLQMYLRGGKAKKETIVTEDSLLGLGECSAGHWVWPSEGGAL